MMHFPVFKGCKCSGKTGYFTPHLPKGGELPYILILQHIQQQLLANNIGAVLL